MSDESFKSNVARWLEMTWERIFIRAQLFLVAAVVLTGMVWGPKSLITAILGAGVPLPGEVVPRQIPYRGYLEQNGVALDSPGVPMRFRLYGVDGGVLHEESRAAVPVQGGQFSVELGDVVPVPDSVLQQNFLELEVALGSIPVVLSGRQRLVSVPYAASAANAWRAAGSFEVARDLSVSRDLVVAGSAYFRDAVRVDGGLHVVGPVSIVGDTEFSGAVRQGGVPIREPVSICAVISGTGGAVACPSGKVIAFTHFGRPAFQSVACGQNAGTGDDIRMDDDAQASCLDTTYLGFGCIGQSACSLSFPAGFSSCGANVVVHIICI